MLATIYYCTMDVLSCTLYVEYYYYYYTETEFKVLSCKINFLCKRPLLFQFISNCNLCVKHLTLSWTIQIIFLRNPYGISWKRRIVRLTLLFNKMDSEYRLGIRLDFATRQAWKPYDLWPVCSFSTILLLFLFSKIVCGRFWKIIHQPQRRKPPAEIERLGMTRSDLFQVC